MKGELVIHETTYIVGEVTTFEIFKREGRLVTYITKTIPRGSLGSMHPTTTEELVAAGLMIQNYCEGKRRSCEH